MSECSDNLVNHIQAFFSAVVYLEFLDKISYGKSPKTGKLLSLGKRRRATEATEEGGGTKAVGIRPFQRVVMHKRPGVRTELAASRAV